MPLTDWPPNFSLSRTTLFPSDFPHFSPQHCESNDVSPYDPRYNCIAWAASDSTRWWWPQSVDAYWPPGAIDDLSIPAFVSAFQTLGYVICKDGSLESGFEKVAIYADQHSVPTHAARQLPLGAWTSKFGPYEDLEHVDVDCIRGPGYGTVVVFMKRGIM